MFSVFAVRVWICISVIASVAGWVLSAFGKLDRLGYAAVGVLVLIAGAVWFARLGRGGAGDASGCRRGWRKCRGPKLWRFRRGLPLLFAFLAFLVLLGGLLYAPTNHTALSYRTPRVLNWLYEGRWHWIYTDDYRLNNRACGLEWLSAPILLFTKSDRWLFLLNYIPFLLLPGLLYSVFTRLGVRARVAWNWMWLLPSGYVFLLQAGSAGNDIFPAVYALAAVDFGLRAWRSRSMSDLSFSVLSAALLTGAKASNLPLLLPLAISVLPLWRVFVSESVGRVTPCAPTYCEPPRRARSDAPYLGGRILRLGRMAGLLLVAALVSFLPTAVLNHIHCGDWSGLNLERTGMDMKNPIVGIWGNALIFLGTNLVPPFFPWASWWNQAALDIIPAWLSGPLVANFEQGWHYLWELPTEDWVGIGFGVSVLMLVSLLVVIWSGPSAGGGGKRRRWEGLAVPAKWRWGVMVAAWIALLAYCMKSGMVTGSRLIAPYYPLLAPLLLVPAGHAALVRRGWWRALAVGSMLLAIPVVVLTPARPLWPAQTILARLMEVKPGDRILTRGLNAYTVYAQRHDPLANVRELLPADLKVVGFMADADDLDISFWRPFGSRMVRHIRLEDSAEDIRRRGIDYIVVGGARLKAAGTSLETWLDKTGAKVVASTTATLKVAEGSQPWYVAHLP